MTSSSSAAAFAGLAAALQLGRARRKVTVLVTGRPRNRFAGRSHGVLGHDHKPPLDILTEARQQLARYPTVRLMNARAERVSGVSTTSPSSLTITKT
ncbi:hypothetical protein [Xanthomonas vesicatoria]|uniref:hypothetical protein n=1 Tax=Xanthomonas vesicatoria TaxID=56460 RepID=UPI001E6462F4|nr:hypothetical protein [Xanthomonas vesicatoria]MCC8619444.1 hypothetical protein [Xanthomonas vesicatoria]MCC8633094.1 hypothetical protein [Xanthomonas vesicatoria]